MTTMTAKQRVLIVDDEPRNQRIIAETLEDLVEMKLAATGEEALAALDSFKPDLILLDIMMPGIDGYEVCRRIRARADQSLVKIILVSGKAMVDERLKGYEVGADDYMTKPFVSEELAAKAKVFLRLCGTERALKEWNENLEHKVQERTAELLDVQSKLVTAAKMSALGEMAGGVAHEVNTPLGTILLVMGQLEHLLESEELDRTAAVKLTKMVSETVRRISSVVQGLRTFSRDGSRDAFQPASVRTVVESALVLCREKLAHDNLDLQMEPVSEILEIECRSIQISQVLLNLISNSCDALKSLPEKWIRLEVKTLGQDVEFAITDSGPGISKELRTKIFQPFFTTKLIGRGTGLGLSISKGIIEEHGGQFAIDESCKNTRFVFTLPMVQAARKTA